MASRSFKRFVEQELGKFPHFVIYAILEWVMIFLLFVDGFVAFFANEFAKFFELRIPCLLCTRIDHVLVRRNSDFYYNDSICETHKKHVSYLAYCHVHKKLSDIRKMCEGCLLSFATEKEFDCDTYKSLVGILHKDLESFVEDDNKINLKIPAVRKDDAIVVGKSSGNRCSCCGDPLKMKTSHSKSSLLSQAPTPSPRAAFLTTLKNEESRNMELPHIRYTELKFMSDTESELPDDEYISNVLIPDNQGRDDVNSAKVPLLTDSEFLNEEACKTPNFLRANRFFGIPLTDSAQASPRTASPRWGTRFPRKWSVDKPELGSEAIEGTVGNDADGESILHRLKRQVRLDRKSLIALYMELDEERSASAVAANNAMAMITRLQAEKAAVQMEALQYQRMMEEQAEYDQEALQVMKDEMNKREEEIKMLEAELDEYREKFGCIREEDPEERESLTDDDCHLIKSQSQSSMIKSQSQSSMTENSVCSSAPFGFNDHYCDRAGSSKEQNGGEIHAASLLDYERERTYLLDRLKYLNKKLSSMEDGIPPSQSSSGTVDNNQGDKVAGIPNKAVLMREVAYLNERLKTLEAQNGFSKHAARTNYTGGEDLSDIAHHLWKLRHFVKMPLEDYGGF